MASIDYNTLYASTLPAGSPQYLTPVNTGSLNAASSSGSGGGFGSFLSGLGSFLKPAVEAGAVIAVTKAVNSGRLPGAETQQNPSVSAAQPVVISANTGATSAAMLQSMLPWLLVGGIALVGLAALRK